MAAGTMMRCSVRIWLQLLLGLGFVGKNWIRIFGRRNIRIFE